MVGAGGHWGAGWAGMGVGGREGGQRQQGERRHCAVGSACGRHTPPTQPRTHPPSRAALSRCFALKVGVLPETVLPKALVDRLVQKGTMLQFVTEFFSDFLATESVEVSVFLFVVRACACVRA